MNRDKQIEEMAKALGIAFQLAGTTRFGEVAEVLVNAGYRKASEVALEVIGEIKKINEQYCTTIASAIVKAKLAELKKKYTEVGE